jgi:integrase
MAQIHNRAIRVADRVAGSTGFRRSETRGLKWKDIDFANFSITPKRGAIRKHLSELKNDGAGKTVFVPEALIVALQLWRAECLYPGG